MGYTDKREVIISLLSRRKGTSYAPFYTNKYGITKEEFIQIAEQLVLDGVARKKAVKADGGQRKSMAVTVATEYYLR